MHNTGQLLDIELIFKNNAEKRSETDDAGLYFPASQNFGFPPYINNFGFQTRRMNNRTVLFIFIQ